MKRILLAVLAITLVVILSGCTTDYQSLAGNAFAAVRNSETLEAPEQSRMLIWRAWLSLEVSSVSNAAAYATGIAKQSGGYIESNSSSDDASAQLTLRVPANSLVATMSSLESIGKVTDRRVSSKDVTEEYVDIDARSKTMVALRDRLRALLEQAKDVKDILAIEKELARVQGDLDSMAARLKALKGQVDFAAITLSIKPKRILGPLGYLFHGLYWGVEKLFVIQE